MSSIKDFIELFNDVWKQGIFGINASEIIIGFVIFLFFYVLRRLFARFIIGRLNKIVLKSKTSIDDTVVEVIEGPLKFLPVVIGFFVASSYVELSSNIQNFIDLINRTLITIFIFWLLHQLTVPFAFLVKSFEEKLTTALVDWTLKGLKIIIIVLGIVAILELWGIKVGPVIAGLGLFGVAVALGAQDLFKNLISGIMILMERRFKIGDVINIKGEAEGTVEQIGFRSTLIREFNSNVVTVPNFKFAEQSVVNHSRRIHRRIRWIVGLEYRTSVDQLKNIRNNVKKFIDEDENFANDGSSYYKSSFVRIENFSDSSIDMLVECFTKNSNWSNFIEIKEKLAIRIKEIVEKENAGFAFPSQSIYVESFSNNNSEILKKNK
ncbi:MAG: Low conductance mechanosensitive channel YnaI [Alphaproteobacteria bacterium MarineAlpha5_Bin8]|nr:MAG: Low conductance mechanosensitive channel YnaI [Alphaproteobacteria bacterium MarineAlpha5_Bin7]PPR46290.1 MAG: Low conductance mechanosensitive channel YnaI [Alphaproteobacteria bacterium MarineAlpha5_Bin8]PPR54235.1 MAG: Low conductance mechanosensitive channel YnaI [Alphaproteobacteria bacterium MarineAlpha5_Bin6]|tara:strand:+ start:678 stop:1814 length:1137 start_codon:yes stop_codon:yes gene_type:complete